MAKHWSNAPALMNFIYEISLLMIKYNIDIWFHWIPSKTNILADALSRYDYNTFFQWKDIFDIDIDSYPINIQFNNYISLINHN